MVCRWPGLDFGDDLERPIGTCGAASDDLANLVSRRVWIVLFGIPSFHLYWNCRSQNGWLIWTDELLNCRVEEHADLVIQWPCQYLHAANETK